MYYVFANGVYGISSSNVFASEELAMKAFKHENKKYNNFEEKLRAKSTRLLAYKTFEEARNASLSDKKAKIIKAF